MRRARFGSAGVGVVEVALVAALAASFAGAAGCSSSASQPAASKAAGAEADGAPATSAVAGSPTATPAAPAPVPARPPEPPPTPKFQIQLRSTPAGAEAAVDGRPAGRTPVTVDILDDGKQHEFTFLLGGYGLERYRTRPVQNGVIHARLRAIPADAGP
jgi:hypothetical protein